MPPVVIELTGLSPNDGFVIQGDAAYDSAGWSVSHAGDVNDDGIDDFIIGALRSDDGGSYSGAAYVIYGKSGPRGRLDLTNLAASDGFVIQGDAAGDYAGMSVSAAGDVNGDGIDDLIVGAPRGDDGGVGAGEAYVIYGKSGSRGRLDLTNLSSSDGFVIQGDAIYDGAGQSVSNAGDVNGDGIDDLIVGAPFGYDGGAAAGEAYFIYGRSGLRGRLDLTNLAASDGFIIQGDVAGDRAGFNVSGAGDVNDDGIDDLIVASRFGDSNRAGEAYVIYGTSGLRGRLDLTNLTANDGFIIASYSADFIVSFRVSDAGDVNGDGIDDLIVGVPRGRPDGEAYVIYGRSGSRGRLDLSNLDASDGFAIQGDAPGDSAGNSVSGAGDVNGDGIDDLIIGAPSGDDSGDYAGEAYVVFGRLGNTRGTLDLTDLSAGDGFIIQADMEGDEVGRSVSGAGDVNGDGIDDLVVGAPYGDDGGVSAGEAYVIYGRLDGGPNGGTGVDDVLNGTTAADAINGLAGDDIIFGDGGNDRLFGAEGSDALFGEAGNDALFGGTGQDKLDGGADNDIISGGIEGDSIRGGDGDDVLDGGAGSDAMNGGTGIDIFTGGEGRDKFRFGDGDTGNTIGTADRITDFDQAQGERISLTLMDAIVGGADDAFTFIGTAAFGNVAGELRYELIGGNTYVMGDTNGDGASDFMIRLDGALVLTGADFSL